MNLSVPKDGLPRLRGERGFIPLAQETLDRYRNFWRDNSANLRETVEPWGAEYGAWSQERVYNGWFECGDAELYYSMIRTLRPNLIIEVGSGFCTRFAVEACMKNGMGQMICIDPLPRTDLPDFVRFEKRPVQEVDLTLFERLGENDILFIDTSHEGEETLYHSLILDRVAPGVTVHHHDFAFPNSPDWPEENIIISYYMNRESGWEGLVNNALARDQLGAAEYGALFPHYAHASYRFPGSIWTRRRATGGREGYRELLDQYIQTAEYARHVSAEYEQAIGRIREMEKSLGTPGQIARALMHRGIRRSR